MNTGIYIIKWDLSGHFYIGQSKDLLKRKARHMGDMKNGYHKNKGVQDIYNKHGFPIFSVLEYCYYAELDAKEEYHIKKYFGQELCLNKTMGATCLGVKRDDETRKKISKYRTGFKLDDKFKPAITKRLKEQYESGKRAKPDWNGEKNLFYGKNHTEDAKRRMSIAKKKMYLGENNPKARLVLNVETGIFYGTIRDAAKTYSINENKLGEKLKGKKTNNTNFILA